MPRQARFIVPHVAVHIIQRGNNRAACFRVESDYHIYLLHLRDLAVQLGCALHAYCLMTNHVHLLLTPPSADACIVLMRNLGQRYVQYFNKRHDRTGTLWEGRFRSCVTESARYVLACYRYIEMNPVRAGLALAAADYPWSSHRDNAGLKADASLTPHVEYTALGLEIEARRAAYLKLFGETVDPDLLRSIRAATNGGYPLGSESFKAQVNPGERRLERARPGRPRQSENSEHGADDRTLDIGL
jgi:putative transposase